MTSWETYSNSLGMELTKIEAGEFYMGFEGNTLPDALVGRETHRQKGDFDEHPAHKVKISQSFHISICQVTNTQYEQFDPEHRKLRGKRGFSIQDDEAVVFVSWYDAVQFCRWLSDKEGVPYRLPTEAEWEYTCRAGTRTPFHTGNTLPETLLKNAGALRQGNETVPLLVGGTPANDWGVYDMHGNVEEWCYDWYGPYQPEMEVDPVGRKEGDFKVTRGGSHSTEIYYLRSANRMGTLPDDKHWLIGFRVVMGELPTTQLIPVLETKEWQRHVRQDRPDDIEQGPDPDIPYFKGPRKYVKIPENSTGPLYSKHNHDPAITKCPNGDILAIWYTCFREPGRELALAASRLRYGAEEWDEADLFWNAPDRNDHAPALMCDHSGTLYHFNGISAGPEYHYGNLALIMRTSVDNGVTWSKARFVNPERELPSQPVPCAFQSRSGEIVLVSDAPDKCSVLWISRDNGQSWTLSNSSIAGIHAGAVQLKDGRLMAFGRGNDIQGKMPQSVSDDMGGTWDYQPSAFQSIGGGQRPVLMRLNQGPLFFASFCKKVPIVDSSGKESLISGLFTAVSLDEGKTWPHIRLVTDDGKPREIETLDGDIAFMGPHESEPVGYLAACQAANNIIHLISSQQHYAFNLKWLQTPSPNASPLLSPKVISLPEKLALPNVFTPGELINNENWKFGGTDTKQVNVTGISDGGKLNVHTNNKEQFRWTNSKDFRSFNKSDGVTVEIQLQILQTIPQQRGIDLELYDGAGGRYAVSITDTGIYWYEGVILGTAYLDFNQFVPLTEDIDNTDQWHRFRLSVRTDRHIQIYRDGDIISVRRFEYRTPREAYMMLGAGSGVKATIDYVAYDLVSSSKTK